MLGSCDILAYVYTNDAARAKKFYGETLGLKFVKQDEYGIVFDAHGITLRVTTLPDHTPTEHPVLGWLVPDIKATAAAMLKAGVKCERYSYLEQDELGIWSSPDGAKKLAFFKDPDGNALSLAQV
jgi:catechol 2,3-dioxygenase-like lactoylglutathione lyase family enzyme